jgi:hypothetical protein
LARIHEPLAHVLWIGGPPCSGKTSVARLLGGRHSLRVYNSDAYTWEHHDKAVARAYPAAAKWESMTPDEAWLGEVGEMVALSIAANEERCRLMIEDLEALSPSPLVVAEGTPLFPWLISDRLATRDHAVWLVPTPEFQRARLMDRPGHEWTRTSDPDRALSNRIERERVIGERIEEAALRKGLHLVPVDGSKDLLEVAAAVEAILEPAIAAGPRASTLGERRALRRDENLQVHRQVSTYFERRPGAGDPETSPVPFVCECGAGGCDAPARATLNDAQRTFDTGDYLLAPAHGTEPQAARGSSK